MRKFLVLGLAVGLFVVALILPPLTGANKNGQSSRTSQAGKTGAQQKTSGPRSYKAVDFAESIPVRDLAAVKAKKFSGGVRERREKDDESFEAMFGLEEKNEKNREIMRRDDPNAPSTPDKALSAKSRGGNAPSLNPPNPPSVDFQGISIADTIAVGQGFLPPDTNGDVGPNHYVQAVNSSFRVWDKAGNPLTPVTTFPTLFGPLGAPCGTSDDGDPIVIYDQLADRWLISEFCVVTNPNNHQLIAISKTGDPTGAYYLYDFMMPNNKFNDYPHFGMWPDAYYMTDNQFNQAGTAFLQGGVFAFDRTKMLIGDPTASFIYFDTAVLFPPGGANGPDGIGGMLPADMEGYIPPAAGAPCPFAYFQAGEFGEPADQLRIFDFHADFAVPANSTFTERTGSPLAVAAFDPRPVPNTRNVVPQPPPATAASFLDAISDRLMYRLSYRNFGASETLVASHTVNAAINPVFRAGVRWYQLNRAAPTAAFTIGEQQTWAPVDTEHRWMGSAANNFQGDLAVGFSTSSLTVFPSVRYAARLGTDTAGTGLAQGETVIEAGGGSQTHSSGRWGDYSDITVDPSDDCSFWYTQEYYTVSSEPGNSLAPWKTRISKFAPGPCATSPRGTISGTVTNCQTGLPIPNAFVSISGGFSRGTDAAGTYSAIVTPGTYNVSVTGTGYDTASTTGVVVANGGSATFNACLNGNLKRPVADTASITADSCNSNGFIDPNETVTVSLGVKNTGTLNTANLVGTLQATGGVTSPSGPQNYGVVVAGGATVFRSFTFTAANLACGAPLVISLQLQDGATDLGTITYNFTTGAIAVSTYSTGDIAVPIPDNPAPAINIPITVADVMTLSDVNVSFRLNHTFDGDLGISVVHPDGTVIPLVNNRGGDGANFGTGPNNCSGVPTLMDDEAATAISAGGAPFAGSFRPESPLSGLDGKPSNGTWNLRIQDTGNLDVGTVGCVKLELNKRSVCCGALINASPPPVITAESVSPANNAADPDETVTVNLSLVNNGGSPTTSLVATLQPTGGVAAPSGPQNYGALAATGGTATRPFTFTAQGSCGSTITLTLALQDGATNLGTVTYTMTLGALITTNIFTENFDGVTAPALPAGWVTAATGSELAWVTSTTNPNSAPNDAFAPDTTPVGNTTFDTPTINVPAGGARLTFRNLYNLEAALSPTGAGFDGMVLEISINGGAFADITTGGNAFSAGGYNRTISSGFSSPIGGRLAWSALSGGTTAAPTYITSTINLPAAAAGQPVKLRWRVATDSSAVAAGAAGVRIDNIVVSNSSVVCNTQTCTITCPANITVPADSGGTSAVVNYPPATPTGSCGVLGYSTPSGSTFPVGTTTVNVTGADAAACSFTVTVQPASGTGENFKISEFRLSGPGGVNDEFIEIYNDGPDETVAAGDGSAGYAVASSDGVVRCTIPNGAVIPQRGHYLCTNSSAGGYSLSGSATGDTTYTTDIGNNVGIALFETANPVNFALATRLDAVGSASEANTLYKEGTGYPALTVFNLEYSFYRKIDMVTGRPTDSDNNATDFYFVDTLAAGAGAGQRLGAPGPENLGSPLQRNSTIKASPIATCVSTATPPNRVRTGSGNSGTLEIRRKFTNNTGAAVTRLRFRIVDITTNPPPAGQADLRAVTSVASTPAQPCGGGTVGIEGLTLETPPTQAAGGGFNSSLSAGTITLIAPLANTATINVNFLLNVAQGGNFRFFVNVEALP